MMLTLTDYFDDKKIAIDLLKVLYIQEYDTGSKLRTIVGQITKDSWTKESPEQICEMANALNKKYNHSVTIYWKESKV